MGLGTQPSEALVLIFYLEIVSLPSSNSRFAHSSYFLVGFQTPLPPENPEDRAGEWAYEKRQMQPCSGWLLACGKRPSVATFPKETRNPNFGVKSHVLNVGDSFFKMLSHQAGETKQEDRRDGIPRPPFVTCV